MDIPKERRGGKEKEKIIELDEGKDNLLLLLELRDCLKSN